MVQDQDQGPRPGLGPGPWAWDHNCVPMTMTMGLGLRLRSLGYETLAFVYEITVTSDYDLGPFMWLNLVDPGTHQNKKIIGFSLKNLGDYQKFL